MDLLGSDTAGRGQPQQQNCGPLGGEKPAAASIDGLSRPSLISSLWSIQVQVLFLFLIYSTVFESFKK
jgi:hypothetical protein